LASQYYTSGVKSKDDVKANTEVVKELVARGSGMDAQTKVAA